MEGFSLGKPSKYTNGEEWCALYFDNVFIPKENVLLGPGGFKKQIAGFNAERIGNTARSLAVGEFAYNLAREHALTREQFGRKICEFQGIQWKFSDMKIQIEAGRLLLYRAAINADKGFPSSKDTSIAKAFCNKAGFDITSLENKLSAQIDDLPKIKIPIKTKFKIIGAAEATANLL